MKLMNMVKFHKRKQLVVITVLVAMFLFGCGHKDKDADESTDFITSLRTETQAGVMGEENTVIPWGRRTDEKYGELPEEYSSEIIGRKQAGKNDKEIIYFFTGIPYGMFCGYNLINEEYVCSLDTKRISHMLGEEVTGYNYDIIYDYKLADESVLFYYNVYVDEGKFLYEAEWNKNSDEITLKAVDDSELEEINNSIEDYQMRSDGIYYSDDGNESHRIIEWMDYYIFDNSVKDVFVLSEDTIGAVYINELGNYEIIYFEQGVVNSYDRKEIVVGCLSSTYETRNLITAFNRSQNEYRVTIKNYNNTNSFIISSDDTLDFVLDIVSGNAPDIILSNGFEFEILADKHILEDLTPYFERDSEMNLDDYLDCIVDSLRYEGRLFYLPASFTISTIVGKSDVLGTSPGWNLDKVLQLMKDNSDSDIFHYTNRQYMFKDTFSYLINSFVDYESMTCRFDSDEFVSLLEVLKNCNDKKTEELQFNEENDWPNRIAKGDLVSVRYTITDFQSLQSAKEVFRDGYIVIGEPTEDGRETHTISQGAAFCMVSQSENKEAAWEFIKYSIKNPPEYALGFPTNKSKLRAIIDEELSKSGQEKEGKIFISSFMQPINAYYATEEEINEIIHIIENARTYQFSSDEIIQIILEEATTYWEGNKSARDAAGVIQGRVQIMLDEKDSLGK